MQTHRIITGTVILLGALLSGCGHPPVRADFAALRADDGRPLNASQDTVIKISRSLLGTPYRFGGITPEGFDCSGFINYVYRNALGLTLPRMAKDLRHSGVAIPVSDLRPADLVFFKIERQKPLHVGIYLGQGRFIHAPSSGGRVNIQELEMNYWKDRFLGARRLI